MKTHAHTALSANTRSSLITKHSNVKTPLFQLLVRKKNTQKFGYAVKMLLDTHDSQICDVIIARPLRTLLSV